MEHQCACCVQSTFQCSRKKILKAATVCDSSSRIQELTRTTDNRGDKWIVGRWKKQQSVFSRSWEMPLWKPATSLLNEIALASKPYSEGKFVKTCIPLTSNRLLLTLSWREKVGQTGFWILLVIWMTKSRVIFCFNWWKHGHYRCCSICHIYSWVDQKLLQLSQWNSLSWCRW